MIRIGILGPQGSWHAKSLQQALARQGIVAPCFPITRLTARLAARPFLSVGEEPLDSFDLLLVRTIPGGSLEQIIFRMDALHRLENSGVRVVNLPGVIERTVDKYYTSTLLEDAGLPTPRAIVAEGFDQALAAFDELGGDVIVKPLFGSEGRGMVRVSDRDVAYRVFRALELGRYVYYLQEFIAHGNEDIRVFVIGDQAVAAMLRRSEGWKTNLAQGAMAEPLLVDHALREISIRATRALGADYAGVDILPVEGGGFTVIEVNGIPGWRGLQAATGVNVAERLVQHLLGPDTMGGGQRS
jgi:RimK family alpha-L-glutamate ligase